MDPNYKKTRNYLVYSLGYSINQSHGIFRRYAVSKGIQNPSKITEKFYHKIGALIQNDWNDFMQFYGSIKKEYKRKYKIKRKKNNFYEGSYELWYQEASMDGSLAYNNSADDL